MIRWGLKFSGAYHSKKEVFGESMDKDKWEITGLSMTRLNGTIKHAECVSRAVVEKNEALNARHNSSEVMRIHGRILDKGMK